MRVNHLVEKIKILRLAQNSTSPLLYLVKDDGDPGMRMWFLSHLIQDRFENVPSYHQFLSLMREQVTKISV